MPRAFVPGFHFKPTAIFIMYPSISLKKLLAILMGLVLSALGAAAAIVPAPLSGDVFLAFRASGGDGSDQSYIVNLGQGSQFSGAAAGSSSVLSAIGNTGADLVAVYGAGWATRTDLFWGVFGTTDSVNPTLYASRERTSVGTQTVPWAQLTQGARSAIKTEILSVASGIGGYQSRAATVNSGVGTFQENAGQASSYNYQVTNGATDFGSQSQWSGIEGDFIGGVSATALDLYRLRGTSPTVGFLGSFSISGAGVVTFTAASAAPPSNVDTDGDGQTDAQETAAGTSTTSGSDFFRVQSVVPTANNITIRFNSAANRVYSIEYSESLAAGVWQVVGTHTAGASGSLVEFIDTDIDRRSKPRGFYRIKVTQ